MSTNLSNIKKKDLIATGFIRELWNAVVKEKNDLPPADVIKLISLWIHLMDTWDNKATDKRIIISHDDDGSECIETKEEEDKFWYHAYGSDIIEYGQQM